MAGHKISGYMTGLWQVLFAPLIHLLARVFCFAKPRDPTQKQTSPAHQPESTPSHPHSSEHHHHSHPHHHSSLGRDPEEGLPSHNDEAMAAAKRRGAQKRGGGKPGGPQTAHKTATSAVLPSNKNSASSPLSSLSCQPAATQTVSMAPEPAVPVPVAHGGHTDTSPGDPGDRHHHNNTDRGGSKWTGSSPIDSFSLGKKENVVPPKQLPDKAASQASKLLPVNHATGYKTDYETAATDCRLVDDAQLSIKPTLEQGASTASQVGETLARAVGQLNLEENLETRLKPPQETTKTQSPVEARPLPPPVVVALPLMAQPGSSNLSVPTAAAPILPGLIEPKTEKERAEREYHLKYMRQALDMVCLTLHVT
jgi:hypothetical protein